MTNEDQKYYEAMLTLTSYPEWQLYIAELKKEIYQTQANCLENAETWERVCVDKGWTKGLAYTINLRDNTKAAMKNADADL